MLKCLKVLLENELRKRSGKEPIELDEWAVESGQFNAMMAALVHQNQSWYAAFAAEWFECNATMKGNRFELSDAQLQRWQTAFNRNLAAMTDMPDLPENMFIVTKDRNGVRFECAPQYALDDPINYPELWLAHVIGHDVIGAGDGIGDPVQQLLSILRHVAEVSDGAIVIQDRDEPSHTSKMTH